MSDINGKAVFMCDENSIARGVDVKLADCYEVLVKLHDCWKPVTNRQQARRLTEQLNQHLLARGVAVNKNDCYEVLAKLHGYRNWDTFSGILKRSRA